jgi:hypothetical protein
VWNKVIKGKQSTICFHVDDCKISHVSAKVNDSTSNGCVVIMNQFSRTAVAK